MWGEGRGGEGVVDERVGVTLLSFPFLQLPRTTPSPVPVTYSIRKLKNGSGQMKATTDKVPRTPYIPFHPCPLPARPDKSHAGHGCICLRVVYSLFTTHRLHKRVYKLPARPTGIVSRSVTCDCRRRGQVTTSFPFHTCAVTCSCGALTLRLLYMWLHTALLYVLTFTPRCCKCICLFAQCSKLGKVVCEDYKNVMVMERTLGNLEL